MVSYGTVSFHGSLAHLHDAAVFPSNRYDVLATAALVQKAHRADSQCVRFEGLERSSSPGGRVPAKRREYRTDHDLDHL